MSNSTACRQSQERGNREAGSRAGDRSAFVCRADATRESTAARDENDAKGAVARNQGS